MKVLVIQPKIGMGDMIIYLPYIHAIANYYKITVSILAKENSRARELLIDDLFVDEILTLDRKKDKSGSHDGIKGFLKLVKEIKLKKFDRVFIFSSSVRYFLLSKLAGIKNISQYPLLKKNDNIVNSAKIFVENELSTIVSTQPLLNLNYEKIKNFKNKKDKNCKHICLGISASGPTKRWDIKNYIALCEKLYSNIPCKFYLAGGREDKILIDEVLKSHIGSHCVSFEDFKISETLPIIKNCDLYIGNDTGWLHIATAFKIKSLALFMDSPVLAYGKYSKYISLIIPKGETESSTSHNTFGKDKIIFDEVLKKAKDLLIN
tara:strand:- start:3738 stop:4697 length:960 start_codon:yes stop_codon:yes gene_type:complete